MLKWLGEILRGTSAGTAPPADPGALVREALAQQQAGNLVQAERILYRALAIAPASAEIQLHLGNLFRLQGRHDAELHCCLEAARLAPDSPQVRNNLGNAYRSAGQPEAAIAEFRKAIERAPAMAEAHFNLGVAVLRRGDSGEALECFRNATRLLPGFADAHLNLGFLTEEAGDAAAAIDSYRRAIAADPGMVEAHVNLGMQLLLCGQLAEGWREYEWRLRYPEYSGADLAARLPRWDGGRLNGRTILLEAEQGFGDAIQFLRYAPLVAERGGRVVVRSGPELAGLVASTPGVAAAVLRGAPLPACDTYCPLPSLPLVFGTTLETVPPRVPYLHPDPAAVARWKERLGEGAADCRVGLVWASQSMHRTAAAKSVALEALAPLAGVPGARFYSLQKGEAAGQVRRAPPGLRMADLSGELASFSDTAAAVASLDLVISVDTAVAHLAGALGKPVWTLLKFAPDWRWLLRRDDCPWYPTMRLFRQDQPRAWQAPIENLSNALRLFVKEGPRAPR